MYLDFAPMEGITTALFRRLHHRMFPGVDHYYTPFLSPTQDRRLTPREQREFLPEYNEGVPVIPQILTKNPEDFLWAAGELHAMGYEEVNLNAGCPSGTVTAKGKGAGLLADPAALDQFLEEIFSKTPCPISVKTRLGVEDPEEFGPILEVYNRYPMTQLIIHPRVRKDFYRHPVRTEAFHRAVAASKNPVSYNGSIVTPAAFARCQAAYPHLTAVMVGQGLVSDPFLAGKIRTGASGSRETLEQFHEELFDGYAIQFESENNAAKRMKELWFYWFSLFEGGQKYRKELMKTRSARDYRLVVQQVFRELPLLEESAGQW